MQGFASGTELRSHALDTCVRELETGMCLERLDCQHLEQAVARGRAQGGLLSQWMDFSLQACIDENFDMVKFLVENKADVNQRDNEGWTPLHAAASCGYLNIAE